MATFQISAFSRWSKRLQVLQRLSRLFLFSREFPFLTGSSKEKLLFLQKMHSETKKLILSPYPSLFLPPKHIAKK